MFTTRLRKVGGSTMLAVPPSLLDSLGLAADSEVSVEIAGGSLLVRGATRERSLEELLAQCDASAPPPEVTGWEDRAPVGGEIL